ncbi:hypothetical protein KKH15_02220 [Patescibacteria group bacterium]|nr:hypothetical protein [Patescibacteria group bacterium]MBU1754866.1 hypothetical protein [Patescibacteria group bacterium]
MKILEIPAEVIFSFGPEPLLLFETLSVLDPTRYSFEFLVDELKHRQFKLVEARKYSATPALTGTVLFRFQSPDIPSEDVCQCDTNIIFGLLRGNMGEPWRIQLAYLPLTGDEDPTGRKVLRIHLMPILENQESVQREQVRSCEYG